MSQEFQMPVMQTPIESDPGVEKTDRPDYDLTGGAEYYKRYFLQCQQNRDVLTNVRVVIPVRPADGVCIRLAQMTTVWYGEGTGWSPLNDHMGGYIDVTRASIAKDFRDNMKEKWLLMIDNDQEPPINLPYLLARHDKPIVGAPVVTHMPEVGPSLCFTVKDEEGNFRFPAMRTGQKIPAKGLIEVGHVGTGALLIRRDVIESFTFGLVCKKCGYQVGPDQLEAQSTIGDMFSACRHDGCEPDHMDVDIPFFTPMSARIRGMARGFLEVGEDIAFCNQVRSKGFPMYVDLEAHVGHRKTVSLLWDDELTDPSLSASDWVVPKNGKIILTR